MIIIVKMRKYLKGKDQSDNNSNIFKEAKRRFHYEPSHKENKYFLHAKHKHQTNSHQFKDDFSSVKEIKNENNEINESSWIVKLVNGMHENLEEDAKTQTPSADNSNNFLSLKPIQSKEIIQEPPKIPSKSPLPALKQQSNEATPLATKKNSISIDMIQKKRSKSQKSQSCDTVSRRSKKHSKVDTIKRNKNEVDLKRNRSQSLIKTHEEKPENATNQMKSLKNITNSKAPEKLKAQSNSIVIDHTHSSRHYSNLTLQSKHSLQINKPSDHAKPKVSASNAQKIPQTQNLHSSICYEEIKQNILDAEDIPDDLFALSTNQKSTGIKTDSHLTTEKRPCIGSIKKNKPCGGSERKGIIPPRQEQPNIQSQLPFKRQTQPVISERRDEDIVTAREEQHLIDKYLNNDYSFKKQSNMFKYDYSTSQFDRSLLHLNKPAINLQKPPNSGKITIKHENYHSKRQERTQSTFERFDQKPARRDPAKKFNYFSQNAEKQTTQNSLSVEILTLRCHQQPKTKENQHYQYAKMQKNEISEPYPTYKQPAFKSANQEDLRRIHQKYNYQVNKQNQYRYETKITSISSVPTKRQNLTEIRPSIINRNPYLQESLYKHEQAVALQPKLQAGSSFQYPTFKMEQKNVPISKQRAQSNFNIDNLNSISRRQRTDSDLFSEAQSQQMITRLNSKLNSYINQYQLQKSSEPAHSSRQNEPTHRRMNLNFNELKKHHEFFQR